jgi:bile acid:Na+ symporter, BASS family
MLELLPRVLTYTFLVSTMLAIGISVTGAEILAVLRDRRVMGRLVLANLVLVPLLGYFLIKLIPLSPGTKLALALLALAPGGLTAIQFTNKVKGSMAFAAAAAFVLTILSIAVTPFMIKVLLPMQVGLDLPFTRLVLFVLLFLLLPLALGFGVRDRMEKAAGVTGKIMLVISNVSFVTTILLTMAMKKEAMSSIGKGSVLAMLLFVVLSMVIGWSMGGPDKGNRRVMAIAASMRNAGLCLIMAMRMFPQSGADAAVVAFMGLMVPPNALYTVYHMVREKLRGKKVASTGTA